jgi:hypothetical protein
LRPDSAQPEYSIEAGSIATPHDAAAGAHSETSSLAPIFRYHVSPFKGEDRWGMGVLGQGHPIPTPAPPLEGEGELFS